MLSSSDGQFFAVEVGAAIRVARSGDAAVARGAGPLALVRTHVPIDVFVPPASAGPTELRARSVVVHRDAVLELEQTLLHGAPGLAVQAWPRAWRPGNCWFSYGGTELYGLRDVWPARGGRLIIDIERVP